MTLTRRRVLCLSAAALVPGAARAGTTWRGRALGGDARITLTGPKSQTGPALARIQALLSKVEQLFNLYDPGSILSQLNRDGRLSPVPPWFFDLVTQADAAFRLTEGRFDPTVQPLWLALAQGRDPTAARTAVGWDRVRFDDRQIVLEPGQALTFNGIAQGYATDLCARALRDAGFGQVLVDIGELRALGGPWQVGLADPRDGIFATRRLADSAMASSSPGALRLTDGGHVLGPRGGRPLWSTVTVQAATATRADALSTGFVLASKDQIRDMMRQAPDVAGVTLVDGDGNIATL